MVLRFMPTFQWAVALINLPYCPTETTSSHYPSPPKEERKKGLRLRNTEIRERSRAQVRRGRGARALRR